MKINRSSGLSRIPVWAASLLCLTSVWAIDPDLPYSSTSTGADGALSFPRIIPGGFQHTEMAFDPVAGKVILFGGNGPSGISSDTWEWSGGDWVRLSPATTPPARYGHRMVYDSVRQEIVMFGGYRNGELGDTWVFKNGNWTEKTPAVAPDSRYYANMVFDAHPDRQKVVLFGGAGTGANTWLWDGTTWQELDTPTDPPNYHSAGITYDAVRQEVVMFNGQGQTWTFDGANWTQKSPVNEPSGRYGSRLVFDPVRNESILIAGEGRNDVWAWNGVNWLRRDGVTIQRWYFGAVWDSARSRVVLFGGDTPGDNYTADTLLWDGTAFQKVSGEIQEFDMSSRANGIWNFTTINVPPGVTIAFRKNAANTPVRWLATGDVNIEGTLNVSGQRGDNSLPLGVVAQGGPGGFAGGRGAVRRDQSGSLVGAPGQGPGGGLPGTSRQTSPNERDGQNGNFGDAGSPGAYGNVFIQPLVGGSGGGGGASDENTNGGNGGGGGGAIFIASSRDITVNGAIEANGGDIEWTGASYGGRGSGGAILLRADRISGTGRLDAFGGNTGHLNGRIRLEAFYRQLAGQTRPVSVNSAPIANTDFNTLGSLTVTRIAGNNVPPVPSGNTLTPDVIFTSAGPIAVTVQGAGIPVGTPVRLRVTTSEGVIAAGPVNLAADNTAVFSDVNVPAGIGTIQAFAEFQVSN